MIGSGEEQPNASHASESGAVVVRNPWDLDSILANRRWCRDLHPFPHVTATDVLRLDAYRDIEAHFTKLLAEGWTRDSETIRFQQHRRGYDAAVLNFDGEVPGPFALFFSAAWHDLLAGLFNLTNAPGYMSGGLHHHSVGSASGGVHNDLNPAWFVGRPPPGAIVLSDERRCEYKTGQTLGSSEEPRRLIRGVAMIFYLANGKWRPEDGGTTGLYRWASDPVDSPARQIPPLDNSLVAFECTPYSFHSFTTNHRSPRNCMVAWIHRDPEALPSRWTEDAVVAWKVGQRRPR
jgi:hypothetical protein